MPRSSTNFDEDWPSAKLDLASLVAEKPPARLVVVLGDAHALSPPPAEALIITDSRRPGDLYRLRRRPDDPEMAWDHADARRLGASFFRFDLVAHGVNRMRIRLMKARPFAFLEGIGEFHVLGEEAAAGCTASAPVFFRHRRSGRSADSLRGGRRADMDCRPPAHMQRIGVGVGIDRDGLGCPWSLAVRTPGDCPRLAMDDTVRRPDSSRPVGKFH